MELPFAENAESRGQNVRRISAAKEILARSRSDCLILISDTNFEVLSLVLQQNIRSYSWFKLTKITTSSDTIYLSFGRTSLAFMFPDVKSVYSTICDILPRILTSTELKAAKFKAPTAFTPKPTGKSAFLRLKEKMKNQSSGIQAILENKFKEITQFSQKRVDLSSIEEPAITMPILMDVLPLVRTVREISIPCIRKIDPYQKAMEFASNQSSVEHITVDGPATKNFEKFLHAIEGNDNIEIYGLTFSNSRFTSHMFDALVYSMKFKEIQSLGMQNAFSNDDASYFYKVFLRALSNKLLYLNLDRTQVIDFPNLINYCKKLQVLSLANCKLEISKILNHFSEKNFPNLNCLNISENVFNNSPAKNIKLTPSLFIVKADKVKWNKHTMAEFFQTMAHSVKKGLYLSIAEAETTNDEWIRVFSYFRSTKFIGLCSLVWKGNPVHGRLFEFLSKNRDLVHLDLTNCFIQSEKEPIESFIKFLLKQQNLKSLILKCTNNTSVISSFIPKILESVEKANSIQHIDISNQKGGNQTLESVINLLNGRSQLDTIVFDGCEPEDETILLQLLQQSTKTKTSAAISYPSKDIYYLLQHNQITAEQIEEINSQIMFEPCKSPSHFDSPYYLYQDEESDTNIFPTYIKQEIEQLHNVNSGVDNTLTLEGMETDEEVEEAFTKLPQSPNNKEEIEKDLKLASEELPPQKVIRSKQKKTDNKQKDQNKMIESKQSSSPRRSSMIEKVDEYKNQTKPQTTIEVPSSPSSKKRKRGRKSSNITSKKSHQKKISPNKTLDTLNTLEAINNNSSGDDERPKTIDDQVKITTIEQSKMDNQEKRIDKVNMLFSKQDPQIWNVPIKFGLYDVHKNMWRKSQKKYSIDRLIYTLRNEKK